MSVRRLGPADYRAMPWANGRGSTVELAREDDAAGNLLWRLSMAEIVEAGDFSPFPGIDRILTLTEGPGFDLDFGPHGRVAPVEPLLPVAFSGDWPTRAGNVRGPSRDLNVMVRRGALGAAVRIMRAGPVSVAATGWTLLLALAGAWTLRAAKTEHRLAEPDLLVVAGAAVTGEGDGILAVVELAAVPG